MEVINSDEDEDRTTEGALSPERMMSPNASFVMHPLDTPPPEAAAAAGLPSSSSAARPAPPPAEDSFTQCVECGVVFFCCCVFVLVAVCVV